ncbi:hypothetical protein AAKU52_001438 [Pedobacter sp. CG_S7]
MPTLFPGYASNVNEIENIEQAVYHNLGENELILPYIQKHEMEALIFSDIKGLEFVVDDQKQLLRIKEIIEKYPNPEDINSSPQGAPSKRLEDIFSYDKVANGELILAELGIEIILKKCLRFANWIYKIENMLKA